MPIPTGQDVADEDKLLLQEHVGSALLCMYEDPLSEPLPDSIMALLELLAAQEAHRATISP
jgi:hypothetical protein